jgi:PRC-barrel domain
MSEELIGKQVVDPHGYRVGKVRELVGREGGERACWALVRLGPLRRSFVPVHDAQDDDGRLRIVYEKEHVKAAPKVKARRGELTDEDANVLHRHYGLDRVIAPSGIDDEDKLDLPRETREAKPPDLSELPPAYERHPIP